MILMNHIKNFAAESPDLFEAFKEYAECVSDTKNFAETSRADMEAAINKAYIEEVEKRTMSRKNALSDKKWANSQNVVEMADQIRDFMIDMILPETLLMSPMNIFCDFRFADLGDSMTFKLENNALYTVSKAGYRKRSTDLQKLYASSATLVPELRQLTVGTDLFEIMAGRVFIGKEVMKAVRSIETAVYFDAYDAMYNAMESYAPSVLTMTNPTETDIIKAAETVAAYNGNRKPIIVGTPVALKNVVPSNNNYRYLLESEFVKLGYIQTFNTYDVIALEQVANPYDTTTDYALKLKDDRIYIVSPASDKLVKVGFGGETMSHTDAIYDNANLLQLSTISKAWDAQVITNSVGAVGKYTA